MINFEIPILPENPGSLVAKTIIVRGKPPPEGERMEGRLSIATPISIPLNEEALKEDDELLQFMRASDGYEYHLVALACSFKPQSGEPFINAWLRLQLETEPGVDAPIAWSMDPRRAYADFKRGHSVGVGLQLQIVGVSAEVGSDGIDRETSIEAFNELQSDPGWEFVRTSHFEISGSRRLSLVVRSPSSKPVNGNIQLTATVEKKHLGIVPYQAFFADAPSLAFAIAAKGEKDA